MLIARASLRAIGDRAALAWACLAADLCLSLMMEEMGGVFRLRGRPIRRPSGARKTQRGKRATSAVRPVLLSSLRHTRRQLALRSTPSP